VDHSHFALESVVGGWLDCRVWRSFRDRCDNRATWYTPAGPFILIQKVYIDIKLYIIINSATRDTPAGPPAIATQTRCGEGVYIVGVIFSTCLALRRAQRIEREVSEAEEARAACAQGAYTPAGPPAIVAPR